MPGGVFFNGHEYISPVTVSAVDDSAMFDRNLQVGNVLAIIGRSEGGAPLTALRFGSPQEARDVLRTGELLKGIEKAFDPSSETNSPPEVIGIRVNPATQSSLMLKGGSAVDAIALVSTDYGRHTNGIRIKVEDGSVKGKKLSTIEGNTFYTLDNVYRDAFLVKYTGAEVTATITVTATTVVLKAPAATTIATLTLADTPTIQQLVDAINLIPDFSADVLEGNGLKPAANGLDLVAATSCIDDGFVVPANVQAAVDWINGQAEPFVTATRQATAGATLTNIPWTSLAGGSDGTVTNTQWQLAFDALQAEDVQWVVPLSDSDAIHAMCDTHVTFMSNVVRQERRAFCGTAVATSDDTAIAAAKTLNSDRTSLLHLGVYDYDQNGNLVLYPPYIAAAAIGGGFAGVSPGTALTNKLIKVRGLERKLRNPVDTDRLILGGVYCLEDTRQGFKSVRSITTWLANNNFNRVEVSTGVAIDFVARNVRIALDGFRGAKASPQTLTLAIERTITALQELARPEPSGPGVIVGDADHPAFKNVQAEIEGDVLRVEFQCSPVIPINYVLITIHAVPWSGKIIAPAT